MGWGQHNENIQINVFDDTDKFELANSSKKWKSSHMHMIG